MWCQNSILVFFLGIFHFASHAYDIDSDKVETSDFDVIVGGQTLNYKQDSTTHGISCTFTWQAQGGTMEQWVMKIGSSEDGKQLSCFVERESGTSYLFFMSFKLEVHGANVKAQHAVANGESGKELMDGKDFKLDRKLNKVEAGDKFDAHLIRVGVYAVKMEKQKEDL
ncbi:myeloid-derived growth factor-like [Gigantopelta aegis]|uniref:myeloid-derived growth factor-like n=1 Tax=Gigantopelta aegis TaxID=1735272 RepID=UPI001B88CA0B|nr:myeloid-derived growth factor-like [Gigantopelta aegis]